jgi:hypothetical protein
MPHQQPPAAAAPIWLPTGPARWSGLESDRPRLVLFYHVEKTGGTAVMKWLHKMANTRDKKTRQPETPRLTSLMDFTHSSCFFALFPKLFPGYASSWDPRRCAGPTKPAWQTAAVGAEFHAYSRRRYWEQLVPKLPELRRLYAAQNGTLLTVATFREPVSHIMSVYRMWPPSRRCLCGGSRLQKHAVPLPSWLHRAVGLQAGSLTLDSWPHMRKGFHNQRPCAEVLPQGRQRLQTFDVVGPMDCMRAVLLRVCALLGWPCDEDMPRMQLALKQSLKYKPYGVSSGGVMMREASLWARYDALNASVRDSLHEAAVCDRSMYDDAIRRVGLEPPSRLGARLNASQCDRAIFASAPQG